MPKRELSKCREWERERRDRLKTCFLALNRVLPCYDPSIVLSKLEILQRATAYITELKQRNKEHIENKSDSNSKDELKTMHDRIKNLLNRVEQLANLLKDAGIKIPTECGTEKEFAKIKYWSNKISKEKAEQLAKEAEKLIPEKSKKKIKPVISTKNSAVQNSSKKTTLKKVWISDNKVVKRRKFKQKIKLNSSLNGKTSKNITIQSLVQPQKTIIHCLPTLNGSSIYVTTTTASSVSSTSFTGQSLVVTNTSNTVKPSIVTNTQLITTPIMTAGINQRNPSLSTLGPGTLILANGNIVPVLPPSPQTIFQPPTIFTAIMNPPNPKPTVVVVKNQKRTNKTTQSPVVNKSEAAISEKENKVESKQYQKIVPKLAVTKTTTINKVPIPALISNFHNSNDSKKTIKKTKKLVVKKKFLGKISESSQKKKDDSEASTGDIQGKCDDNKLLTADRISDSKIICDDKKLNNVEKESQNDKKDVEISSNNTEEIIESITTSQQNKLSLVANSIYSIDSLCKNGHYEKSEDPTDSSIQLLSENVTKDKKDESKDEINEDKTNNQSDSMKELLENKEISQVESNKNDKHDNSIDKTTDKTLSPNKIDKEVSKEKEILQLEPETIPSENVAIESNTKPSEALTLSLPQSEFSNDIFASLHVPSGTQHPESISPTAAFLLAFPLVSTLTGGKVAEVVDDENSDSQHGTPTLLQIGNIENNKNPSDNLASNLLSLDNIHNFFNQKDFNNYEIGKVNKKSNETDYENDPSINIAMKNKNKEPEPLINKTTKDKTEKFETFNQFNSNCIFSDMPLFQNTIANNIFNYEHTPVTYSIAKQGDGSSDVSKVLPFSEKKASTSTVASIVNSSTYSYQQSTSLTSSAYNNTAYPKLNMSNNNAPSINTIANNTNYHSSSYYNPLTSTNLESSFVSDKYLDKQSVNPIYSNYSSNNSSAQNTMLESKLENASLKNYNNVNDASKTEHHTRNDKTKPLNTCQNAYTTDNFRINKEQYKYSEVKSNDKISLQSSYSNNESDSATFKTNYALPGPKITDKNLNQQKPLVNWMTAPDIRPTNDLLLPTFGKDNENTQNVFYSNSNYAANNQTFYNANNHNHYANVSSNLSVGNEVSRKANAIESTFPVIPPPNYPRVSNTTTHTDENQFSWSPSKFPSFLDHSQHNILVPSTLPTLIGDLALNTHLNQGKIDKNDCEPDFNKKKDDNDKPLNSKDVNRYKGKQLFSESNNSNNFLSVSQLVDQSKNDMNLIRNSNNTSQNINRKSASTSRSSKSNTKHNKSTRIQKMSDESKCLNNSSMMDMYITNKPMQETENKLQANDVYRQQTNSFRLSNISDTNANKDIDWAKSNIQDNKSVYKNCSSNYSAEALIGHNVMQSNHNLPKTNRYTPSNHYGQTKRSQITTPFATETPFYSSVDYPSAEGSHYYSQASCNSFTYTASTTVYQPSNFMTNTSTSNSNFVNTPGMITELESDYNAHLPVMSSNNLHPTKDISYNKIPNNNKPEQRQISNNVVVTAAQEKRNHNFVHNSTNKRSNKRKQFSQETTNMPGIVDIGFLPMPAINSPIITEDPFHSHPNFYSTNATQLFHSNNTQNSLYSKPLNQSNHDLSTPHSCNLLPPFSAAPVRNNILASTQLPAPSPTIASAGTSLTNFNLSTIFPEINKPGNISLPTTYDPFIKPSNLPSNPIQTNTNFSNVLQGQTTPQVNFGNKPYYNSSEFHHKVSTSQFHN